MLPVLDKHDMTHLLEECCAWVLHDDQLMSASRDDPNYVLG